ncbi:TPA: hypothetical protein L2X82_005663, partial [Escherichia coli]|nr:hypothetical protein [Escherichia coli]
MKLLKLLYWYAIVALTAFLFGFVHIKWVYSSYFHGDSAVMQVLGQAIYDSISILPHDFYFGNQLILLRSGLPIAIAIFLGFHGYDAFVVGFALGIVAWSLVLYFSLSCAFKTKWQPFLFTFCLLFPTSFGFDSDFILGQQSHLANVILLLAALIFYVLNISSGYKRFLILSGCSFFIICVEEPIRAAFLLLTIIFISIICFDYKKYYLKLIVLFSFALLGSLCNKLLL